jgi:hypothetical protein
VSDMLATGRVRPTGGHGKAARGAENEAGAERIKTETRTAESGKEVEELRCLCRSRRRGSIPEVFPGFVLRRPALRDGKRETPAREPAFQTTALSPYLWGSLS